MSSLSQIIANRANAQLSTGPRTAEGKARSSRNRLTHGLCGPHTILSDEDPAEYQYLIDALMDEHDPATATETLLVAQMAQAQWKLNRIARFEANLLASNRNDDPPPPPGVEPPAVPPGSPAFPPTSDLRSPTSLPLPPNSELRSPISSGFLRYESAAHRAFDRALNNLRKLKSDRAQAAAPARRTARDLDRESDRHLLDLVFGPPAMARRAAREASGFKQSASSSQSAASRPITRPADFNDSNPNPSQPACAGSGPDQSAVLMESMSPNPPLDDSNPTPGQPAAPISSNGSTVPPQSAGSIIAPGDDSNPIPGSASLASIRRILSAVANDSNPIPPGDAAETEEEALRQAQADEWLDAWLEDRPRPPLSSLADCESKPNR